MLLFSSESFGPGLASCRWRWRYGGGMASVWLGGRLRVCILPVFVLYYSCILPVVLGLFPGLTITHSPPGLHLEPQGGRVSRPRGLEVSSQAPKPLPGISLGTTSLLDGVGAKGIQDSSSLSIQRRRLPAFGRLRRRQIFAPSSSLTLLRPKGRAPMPWRQWQAGPVAGQEPNSTFSTRRA